MREGERERRKERESKGRGRYACISQGVLKNTSMMRCAVQRAPWSNKLEVPNTGPAFSGFHRYSEALRRPAIKKHVIFCITPKIFHQSIFFSFNTSYPVELRLFEILRDAWL